MWSKGKRIELIWSGFQQEWGWCLCEYVSPFLTPPFHPPQLTFDTVQWDNGGISIFFFPRNSIPNDITANAPNPDSWGKPMAFWPSSGCDPFKFFKKHSLIFDTTLCGDWASSAWTGSGIPGQEQSCAQRTGVSTCEEFIRNNGAAFNEACKCLRY